MDASKMEAGVRLFLEGIGERFPGDDLENTPARVARAWVDDLVAGYALDPEGELSFTDAPASCGPVIARDIRFASESKPIVRKDAPRPADMTSLFPILDQASGLFVREQYAEAIPLLEKIRAADPHNLDAALRLASAHSALGHDAAALAAFHRAEEIAPTSQDVQTYLALHYARGKEWPRAVPMLERIVAESPDRLPPLEALAVIRERQGRIDESMQLRQKIYTMRAAKPAELVRLGEMAMAVGRTDVAIEAFEKARALQGPVFAHDLELGVVHFAAHQFNDARAALDRVPPSHPAYPMVLFKRAQLSVLLHEPDSAARIELAKQHADATTRQLIARERLFQK